MKEAMKNLKVKVKVHDVVLFVAGILITCKGNTMLKSATEGKKILPYTVIAIGTSVTGAAIECVLDRNFKPKTKETSEK